MKTGRPGQIRLIFLAVLLAFATIGLAYAYYQAQWRTVGWKAGEQLAAIADLKAGQFAAWRRERISDAKVIASNPLVARAGGAEGELKNWLESLDFPAVSITDQNGRVRISTGDKFRKTESERQAVADAARHSGKPSITDLHWTARGEISMAVAAPIPGGAGVVVLRVDPYPLLYPMIREWPILRRTGESLLVQAEDTVILNEIDRGGTRRLLQRRTGTPDSRLTNWNGIRGREIQYFTDYRGKPVLAAISPVPDTPLCIVAKMDEDEIFSPLKERFRLVGLLLMALMVGAGLIIRSACHTREQRMHWRQQILARERRALAERYTQLRSCVNDSILMIDEQGRIVEANDKAFETYGYSPEELLTLSIRELRPRSDYGHFAEIWDEVEDRGFAQFESVHQRKDGSTFPVEVSVRLLEVNGRKFHQSIVRDISERKQAEAEVIRANRALRVLSACNQALVRTGTEDLLLDEVCLAITEIGGYPLAWIGFAEDDPQKTVRAAVAAGPAAGFLDAIQVRWSEEPHGRGLVGTCIRSGATAVCNDTRANPDFGPWREKADRFGLKSLIALPLYCEGIVIGALAIYAGEHDAFGPEERRLIEELGGDLAFGIQLRRRELERAKAEAALRQSELLFRTVFENANDEIYISDLDGRFLEVNGVACRHLGYSREELLRMHVKDIDGSPSPETHPGLIMVQVPDGQVFEAMHVRRDGSHVPVEISARAFEFKGVPSILGVVREIAERKRVEAEMALHARELERARAEAEAANRAKSDFLTHMSHEMRTPMNGVIGMTSLLMETQLIEEQREHAEAIRSSADSLLSMINSILALSQIENDKAQLVLSSFDLMECLREIADLVSPRAAAKGLSFQFDGAAPRRHVCGDAGRLRQIVLNLLGNAIKFTERGSVNLRVAVEKTDTPAPLFQISVTDTGIGIPEEKLPLLFRKFAQLDSSMVRKYEGAGLGLAVSRKLAQLMGGSITVKSEWGSGSEFTLHVPLAFYEREGMDEGGDQSRTLGQRTRHVLLVEDNPVNQKLGLRILEKLGCQVDVAWNGVEAVEKAAQFPYDLIFMDCRMPEMDGMEASRTIRSRLPGGSRLPIVALTAHAVAGAEEECLGAGMDDYLTKPVRPDDLKRMLLRWSP